ncbi:MAG: hypothetical protein JWQ37_1747, partial [Blastococcus sp.]|nr:hypothetical protein [Blastococcus sp.]
TSSSSSGPLATDSLHVGGVRVRSGLGPLVVQVQPLSVLSEGPARGARGHASLRRPLVPDSSDAGATASGHRASKGELARARHHPGGVSGNRVLGRSIPLGGVSSPSVRVQVRWAGGQGRGVADHHRQPCTGTDDDPCVPHVTGGRSRLALLVREESRACLVDGRGRRHRRRVKPAILRVAAPLPAPRTPRRDGGDRYGVDELRRPRPVSGSAARPPSGGGGKRAEGTRAGPASGPRRCRVSRAGSVVAGPRAYPVLLERRPGWRGRIVSPGRPSWLAASPQDVRPSTPVHRVEVVLHQQAADTLVLLYRPDHRTDDRGRRPVHVAEAMLCSSCPDALRSGGIGAAGMTVSHCSGVWTGRGRRR